MKVRKLKKKFVFHVPTRSLYSQKCNFVFNFSLIGFIGTVPKTDQLYNSIEALNIFISKLFERIDICSSINWTVRHQPGYPNGYEIGGIDSWEHEPVEELKKELLRI